MIAVGIFQFSINCTFIPFALSSLYLPTTTLIGLYSQLDTTQSYLGRRNLHQGIAQILLACTYNSEGLFWLMIEDRPTVGSTIPEEVGLVCIRKLTEHEAQREPVNSIPLSLASTFLLQVPALTFRNGGLWPGSLSEISPFLPKPFLVNFVFCFVFLKISNRMKLNYSSFLFPITEIEDAQT